MLGSYLEGLVHDYLYSLIRVGLGKFLIIVAP